MGVLIALLIDNFRENVRDEKIIRSYLDIVREDLNIDIENLTRQLKKDSSEVQKLKILNEKLTLAQDLPYPKFGQTSWTKQDTLLSKAAGGVNLTNWDSLDYYTIILYSSSEYKIRQIGFPMIVNSDLSHLIDHDLLKELTIYYTSDSQTLDFITSIDEKCLWTIIPFLNRYQGTFNKVIRMKDIGIIGELRNDAGGRYWTMIREMFAKQEVMHKAKELLAEMDNY